MNAVGESDIVFLQRDIGKFHDQYEQLVELAHRHNKPVIFDLDDLLIGLPKDHPDRISVTLPRHYYPFCRLSAKPIW